MAFNAANLRAQKQYIGSFGQVDNSGPAYVDEAQEIQMAKERRQYDLDASPNSR